MLARADPLPRCPPCGKEEVVRDEGPGPFRLENARKSFASSPLQYLAGYYHINDGHLLDNKNK